MKAFKVQVTVINKRSGMHLWEKTHLILQGDKRNLKHLQRELNLVKSDVNSDMNSKGLALKDVDIFIDL